jgi:hypothetical protein
MKSSSLKSLAWHASMPARKSRPLGFPEIPDDADPRSSGPACTDTRCQRISAASPWAVAAPAVIGDYPAIDRYRVGIWGLPAEVDDLPEGPGLEAPRVDRLPVVSARLRRAAAGRCPTPRPCHEVSDRARRLARIGKDLSGGCIKNTVTHFVSNTTPAVIVRKYNKRNINIALMTFRNAQGLMDLTAAPRFFCGQLHEFLQEKPAYGTQRRTDLLGSAAMRVSRSLVRAHACHGYEAMAERWADGSSPVDPSVICKQDDSGRAKPPPGAAVRRRRRSDAFRLETTLPARIPLLDAELDVLRRHYADLLFQALNEKY